MCTWNNRTTILGQELKVSNKGIYHEKFLLSKKPSNLLFKNECVLSMFGYVYAWKINQDKSNICASMSVCDQNQT